MCRVAEESLVKEGQKCIGEDASRQQVDDAYMLVFTLGDMSPPGIFFGSIAHGRISGNLAIHRSWKKLTTRARVRAVRHQAPSMRQSLE